MPYMIEKQPTIPCQANCLPMQLTPSRSFWSETCTTATPPEKDKMKIIYHVLIEKAYLTDNQTNKQ